MVLIHMFFYVSDIVYTLIFMSVRNVLTGQMKASSNLTIYRRLCQVIYREKFIYYLFTFLSLFLLIGTKINAGINMERLNVFIKMIGMRVFIL